MVFQTSQFSSAAFLFELAEGNEGGQTVTKICQVARTSRGKRVCKQRYGHTRPNAPARVRYKPQPRTTPRALHNNTCLNNALAQEAARGRLWLAREVAPTTARSGRAGHAHHSAQPDCAPAPAPLTRRSTQPSRWPTTPLGSMLFTCYNHALRTVYKRCQPARARWAHGALVVPRVTDGGGAWH